MHFIISNTKKSRFYFSFAFCFFLFFLLLFYLETAFRTVRVTVSCVWERERVSVKTAIDKVKGFLQWMLLENTEMTVALQPTDDEQAPQRRVICVTQPPALTPPSSWPPGSSPGSCAKKTAFSVPSPSKIWAAINSDPGAHLFHYSIRNLKEGRRWANGRLVSEPGGGGGVDLLVLVWASPTPDSSMKVISMQLLT